MAKSDQAEAPRPYGEEDRVRLLQGLGAGEAQLAELLRYTENPYRGRAAAAALPAAEEGHVAVWRQWVAEVAREAAEVVDGSARQGRLGTAAGGRGARAAATAGVARRAVDGGAGAAAVLARHLVQLRFPVRAGMSQEEVYRAATRRGEVPPAGEAEGLRFENPAGIRLEVAETLAGPVPVIVAAARADFESLVRALAGRNEPIGVPAAMGACLIKGLINWRRVQLHRERWQGAAAARGEATDEGAWQQEMARLAQDRDAYQDRLLLLSSGPYSAVPAAEAGYEGNDAGWRAASVRIRREHEAWHYLTLRLFGSIRSNLLDELLADMAGLLGSAGGAAGDAGVAGAHGAAGVAGAPGEYRAALAQRFLGVDQLPALRADARLLVYTREPELSPAAVAVLARLAAAATVNLQRLAAARPAAASDPRARAALLLELADGTLEELADEAAMERRCARRGRRQPRAAAAGRAAGAAGTGIGNAAGGARAKRAGQRRGAAGRLSWSCRAASATDVGDCLASFDAFARRESIADGLRADIEIVLDEILTNSVRHAGGVDVVLERGAGGAWDLRFVDAGPAFDPLGAPAPAVGAPLAERTPGGVGIELVRRLAESVAYERRGGENRFAVRMRGAQ